MKPSLIPIYVLCLNSKVNNQCYYDDLLVLGVLISMEYIVKIMWGSTNQVYVCNYNWDYIGNCGCLENQTDKVIWMKIYDMDTMEEVWSVIRPWFYIF